MTTLEFLRESLRTIQTTGAVMPSSKFLTEAMLQPIDFSTAKVIVELGAGDGVFTKSILNQMRPDAILLCFEINPKFCDLLRNTISDPRFHLIEDSAELLAQYLQTYGVSHADYIVSGLPFIALPEALAVCIVNACFDQLRPKGLFIQFHYSAHPRRFYQRIFGNLKLKFVPINMPPAFVMICEKK
jgi:phospholipid N-methyltransferase